MTLSGPDDPRLLLGLAWAMLFTALAMLGGVAWLVGLSVLGAAAVSLDTRRTGVGSPWWALAALLCGALGVLAYALRRAHLTTPRAQRSLTPVSVTALIGACCVGAVAACALPWVTLPTGGEVAGATPLGSDDGAWLLIVLPVAAALGATLMALWASRAYHVLTALVGAYCAAVAVALSFDEGWREVLLLGSGERVVADLGIGTVLLGICGLLLATVGTAALLLDGGRRPDPEPDWPEPARAEPTEATPSPRELVPPAPPAPTAPLWARPRD